MSHQEERRLRIDWLLKAIKACGDIDNKNKIMAEFCLKFGASRRYAQEYIKDLLFSGKIEEIGDFYHAL